MMDMFTECLLKRRKHFKEYAIIFPLIILGFAGTLFYLLFIWRSIISGVGFAAVVVMWWAISLGVTNQNKEFEYTVTNNYIDIDEIIAQKKRKRLISFNAKDIEKMAPIEQLDENETFAKTIDASAHDDRFDVYFISAVVKGEKTKILVNPSRKMLDILKTFRPENIIIGEE
ncbi:MAG: hypothetical protein IKT39_06260 [Clostridia bacterium]|nr:hypothetical protein [Clostridia bacterium]